MSSALIDIHQARKTFRKGTTEVHAVAGVDYTITRGDYLAIMGPSGCGKSTLLHLIGGLDTLSAGAICFGDSDLARMNDRQLSRFRNRHVGFVFQAFNLLPELTVLDNVALPLKYASVNKAEARKRARAALQRVGLADRANHNPAELSGGQEQRTAIARALVVEPDIILADEPTGNLDSATRDQILALFADLNKQGTTLLIVTHDPAVSEQARHTLHMRDGQLVTS